MIDKPQKSGDPDEEKDRHQEGAHSGEKPDLDGSEAGGEPGEGRTGTGLGLTDS